MRSFVSHLYATDPAGAVVGLNPQTGQQRYSLSQAVSVLAVDGSQVYATCGSQGRNRPRSMTTALAVGDGRIAVVTDLRVLDLLGLPGY